MHKPPDRAAKIRKLWRVFQAPLPRGVYDFRPDSIRSRTSKERFRSRVKLNPSTGCWVWEGPIYGGNPVTYQWLPDKARNDRRSAFLFLIENWFPDTKFSDRTNSTVRTCGTAACISPLHRQGRSYDHITVLTPSQVREVFAERGKSKVAEVAASYGVGVVTIYNIWSGRSHAGTTGQRVIARHVRKLNASQVKQIYRRKGTVTQTALAAEYGVTRSTIGHIWSGETWSNVTGHQSTTPSLPGRQLP